MSLSVSFSFRRTSHVFFFWMERQPRDCLRVRQHTCQGLKKVQCPASYRWVKVKEECGGCKDHPFVGEGKNKYRYVHVENTQ